MVKRVFDRRGRQNWDSEKHEAEDRRMRERRSKSDRRVHQRRQDNPWPDGVAGDEQRIAERRVYDRRAGVLETASGIAADAVLLQAISVLATQGAGWIAILNEDQKACGILSEGDVIEAIANDGPAALSEPISRYMTPLTS